MLRAGDFAADNVLDHLLKKITTAGAEPVWPMRSWPSPITLLLHTPPETVGAPVQPELF